ncbi:PAS domain-containing protein [Dongia sedimenti]|uniref:PAS domain-containing protein n=1 Tax=Dongia sedimenti TaxID=3064282 RepID=A0ABU0YVX6_9PROT|nr:PAS domain-containing protein [Rhodospirillaceae bacterium R-7]
MNRALMRIADYMAGRKHRSEIDPIEIDPDLLPHLFLIDVLREAASPTPRLRIRLTGTALDQAFGRSVKGHPLEEFMHGPRSADVLDAFRACATNHVPIWMRQIVEIRDKPARYVEGVVFHLDPDVICGGLILGEMTTKNPASSFEKRFLST